MNGPWLAAAAAFATVAFGLQLEFPSLLPAWLGVALLEVNCFVGGLLLSSSKRTDLASLPLVDFLSSDHDLVLDAGCGGGRTTLALSKVLKNGRVVALDRFDSWDICDQATTSPFDLTKHAWAKAAAWARRDEEWVKRAEHIREVANKKAGGERGGDVGVRAARWVAADALRELRSEKRQAQLRSMAHEGEDR